MKRFCGYLAILLLLCSSFFLISCSGLFGNSASTPTPTPSALPLAKLRWCSKPVMVFRDEGAAPSPTASSTASPSATTTPGTTATAGVTPTTSPAPGTPTTITNWNAVKNSLGFTLYLPSTLPGGSCLVSAQATIHDPLFGGSFLIGYLLPDHTSLTISEAPVTSQNSAFQCSSSTGSTPQPGKTPQKGTPAATPSPTQAPVQICSGAKNTTNIVLSARRSVEYLQRLFNSLQPDVAWIPAS